MVCGDQGRPDVMWIKRMAVVTISRLLLIIKVTAVSNTISFNIA